MHANQSHLGCAADKSVHNSMRVPAPREPQPPVTMEEDNPLVNSATVAYPLDSEGIPQCLSNLTSTPIKNPQLMVLMRCTKAKYAIAEQLPVTPEVLSSVGMDGKV